MRVLFAVSVVDIVTIVACHHQALDMLRNFV